MTVSRIYILIDTLSYTQHTLDDTLSYTFIHFPIHFCTLYDTLSYTFIHSDTRCDTLYNTLSYTLQYTFIHSSTPLNTLYDTLYMITTIVINSHRRRSMSFLGIKDPDERDEQIAKYLTLKQRLKERDLEERGDYMDCRRELQENFEPVFSSNQKMAELLQVS